MYIYIYIYIYTYDFRVNTAQHTRRRRPLIPVLYVFFLFGLILQAQAVSR